MLAWANCKNSLDLLLSMVIWWDKACLSEYLLFCAQYFRWWWHMRTVMTKLPLDGDMRVKDMYGASTLVSHPVLLLLMFQIMDGDCHLTDRLSLLLSQQTRRAVCVPLDDENTLTLTTLFCHNLPSPIPLAKRKNDGARACRCSPLFNAQWLKILHSIRSGGGNLSQSRQEFCH